MGWLDPDDGGHGGVLGARDHRGGPCHSLPHWLERHQFRTEPPDDVLAERFARGEIDENEYRQRLSALREHP
jgi:hypothetical protein